MLRNFITSKIKFKYSLHTGYSGGFSFAGKYFKSNLTDSFSHAVLLKAVQDPNKGNPSSSSLSLGNQTANAHKTSFAKQWRIRVPDSLSSYSEIKGDGTSLPIL